MDAERFEYLMNELFYGLFLFEGKFHRGMEKIIDLIFFPLEYIVSKFIIGEERLRKIEEKNRENNEVIKGVFKNLTDGMEIGGALRHTYLICFSIPWFFSWIFFGIIMWTFGDKGLLFAFLPFASTMVVYCYAKWAVEEDGKYVKYLRIFKKKDGSWQKKMERIGIIANILGLILFMGGIILGTKLCDGWLIGYFIEKG